MNATEPAHIHGNTIGAVELDVIQKDGWQLETTGPECANGWPCVFVRGSRRKVFTLSNDLTRWPDPVKTDSQQFTLALT